MDTPAVQFSSVGIANMNQQRWHHLAETARPQLNQQESPGGPGPAGTPGEVLCHVSLNEVKISEDEDSRPINAAKPPEACVPRAWVPAGDAVGVRSDPGGLASSEG